MSKICVDCGGSASFFFVKPICIFCEKSYVFRFLEECVERIVPPDLAHLVVSYLDSSGRWKTLQEMIDYNEALGRETKNDMCVWFDKVRNPMYIQVSLQKWIREWTDDNDNSHSAQFQAKWFQNQKDKLSEALRHKRYDYKTSRYSCEVSIDFLKDASRLAVLLWSLGHELESYVLFSKSLYSDLFKKLNPKAPEWHPISSKQPSRLNPNAREWYPISFRQTNVRKLP
jgi:hypothetical protein